MISVCSLAQSGIVVTGQSVQTGAGKISASIGQPIYKHATGTGGNVNEGIQQSFTITVEVQEQDSLQFSVYPNPTQDAVFIASLPKGIKTSVEVFSETGQKVLDKTFLTSGKESISIKEFPVGVYVMKVSLDNQHRSTFRIIKI